MCVSLTDQGNHVVFSPSSKCNSRVGMQGGKQTINLTPQCMRGNAIHEIGHTLGLWHEQSREDRDDHIEVVWANIKGNHAHNFNKHANDGDDYGKYDYGSIMHYSAFAFAKDKTKPTLKVPDGVHIGQRTGLSAGDIATIEAMYSVFS